MLAHDAFFCCQMTFTNVIKTPTLFRYENVCKTEYDTVYDTVTEEKCETQYETEYTTESDTVCDTVYEQKCEVGSTYVQYDI